MAEFVKEDQNGDDHDERHEAECTETKAIQKAHHPFLSSVSGRLSGP